MDTRSRSTLSQLLIAKSMAEALLITAVAVGFYFTTTNPYLRGVLDVANEDTVAGWGVDDEGPSKRVEVQLYIDGSFVADRVAAEFRPDVCAAGKANDDWHGFGFTVSSLSPGEHEARVYAVHAGSSRQTLQLIGKPLRF